MKLKFICPDCKTHTIECCLDGPHVVPITKIEDEDLEFGEYESTAQVDRYQCQECGFVLENVTDDEEVIEWVKDNCSQFKS